MDLGLTGHVALVVGGTRGLGRACADQLAAEGVKVAVTGRNEAAAEQAAEELRRHGADAVGLALDLQDEPAVESVVAEVVRRWNRLDVLVASSPGPPSGPVDTLTAKDWRTAMEMNFLSLVHLTDQVLPHMRRAGYGKLHYIGTIGVRVVQKQMALSNATRLALLGYVKTLAAELGPEGIIPNFIAPGPIATDRFTELIEQTAQRTGSDLETARESWVSELPLGRAGTPQELAMLVATLSSPHCSYTTGAVIPVDGGKAVSY
ncbi:SDR family oxidoreductase [Amycolatopsis jejuensis]|uniref:SDR family oxidoreductase n=1 Tax=Amycolatopsis jejuensis TaxID=330084 RepID=UPI0005262528|nr:SDR family oxidoreductase [Amycolatopsis jejuensis]